MQAARHQTGSIPLQTKSNTQRIPTVSKGTDYPARQGQIRRRKLPLHIVVLRWIYKNRQAAAVALAALLFISVSVPLVVFAASSPDSNPSVDFEIVDKERSDKNVIIAEHAGSAFGNASTLDTSDEKDTVASDSEEGTDASSGNDSTEDQGEGNTSESVTDPELPSQFPVTIGFYDREAITCLTGPATLREILANAGYTLRDSDRPSVSLDDVIEYESWIMIDSVTYKTVTESEAIPFDVETYNVQTVPRGTTRTISAGVAGSMDRVYTVEYLNGVEVSRTFEYEYVASYPTNQIEYYGTGGTFYALDGTAYSYSYYVNVRATYYNVYGNTYTGMPVGHNVIAVDPTVFPLGTNMYVISDKYDMGVRVAADIGGGVKGNLIDIWMDETNPQYYQFAHEGIVNMVAYILD